MTRDDIISMAKESAAECLLTLDSGLSVWRMSETELQQFANLVAAYERERCLFICESKECEEVIRGMK